MLLKSLQKWIYYADTVTITVQQSGNKSCDSFEAVLIHIFYPRIIWCFIFSTMLAWYKCIYFSPCYQFLKLAPSTSLWVYNLCSRRIPFSNAIQNSVSPPSMSTVTSNARPSRLMRLGESGHQQCLSRQSFTPYLHLFTADNDLIERQKLAHGRTIDFFSNMVFVLCFSFSSSSQIYSAVIHI